jgi:hypothetical protein
MAVSIAIFQRQNFLCNLQNQRLNISIGLLDNQLTRLRYGYGGQAN